VPYFIVLWLLVMIGCGPGIEQVRTREDLRREEESPSIASRYGVSNAISTTVRPPLAKDERELSFISPRGEKVVLRYRKTGRSIGKPNRGALEGGTCIPDSGPHYIHMGKANCGTDEMVAVLMWALGEVAREFPGTPPVVLGALSRPGGGRVKPHKSHRSGRDVDIGFYALNNRPLRTFEPLAPEEIDFQKTFFLMAYLVSSGRVQMIYVNHRLQPFLREAARAMGYDQGQLDWLFEYPRPRKSRKGVVRHEAGHYKHFHVRFACPREDKECTD